MQTMASTTNDVLSTSSDPSNYRAGLAYVSQHLGMITHAWSQPSLPEPAVSLAALQELAKAIEVPRGCERAHQALMCAMSFYREAREAIRRQRLNLGPSEDNAPWEHVRDGYVLLSLAIKLADEA
jgi:hypothetical protein